MLYLRSIAIFCSALLVPSVVLALGLGNIEPKSPLGAPLKAEIEIINPSALEANEISARLASNSEFARFDVTRLSFLGQIKFQLRTRVNGKQFLLVTTRDPVKEPYLNFILEIRWPHGQLLREYALLLDPPMLPQINSKEPAPGIAKPANPPTSQNNTTTVDSDISSKPVSIDSYQTRSGDSLWGIASRVRPSQNVSINQTMQALHELNKTAFINNNINLLKVHQTLKIPTEGEVQHYSAVNAKNNTQPNSNQTNTDRLPSKDPDSLAIQEQSTIQTEPASETATATSTKQPEKPITSSEDKLHLLNIEEEFAAAQQEVNQLQTTYNELMEEKAILLRSLLLQYEELESLKQKQTQLTSEIEQQRSTLQTPAVASSEGQTRDNNSNIDNSPTTTLLANNDQEAGLISIANSEPLSTQTNQTVIKHPAFIAATTTSIILFLALLYLVFNKRKPIQADPLTANAVLTREQQTSSFSDNFADDTSNQKPSTKPKNSVVLLEPDPLRIESDPKEELEDELDETIRAANIYLAYGRLMEAESLIQDAVQLAPEREDLQLMLLELYCKGGNVTAFDEQAAALIKSPSSSVQQQVHELQRLFDRPSTEIPKSLLAIEDNEVLMSDEELGLNQPTFNPKSPSPK